MLVNITLQWLKLSNNEMSLFLWLCRIYFIFKPCSSRHMFSGIKNLLQVFCTLLNTCSKIIIKMCPLQKREVVFSDYYLASASDENSTNANPFDFPVGFLTSLTSTTFPDFDITSLIEDSSTEKSKLLRNTGKEAYLDTHSSHEKYSTKKKSLKRQMCWPIGTQIHVHCLMEVAYEGTVKCGRRQVTTWNPKAIVD